MERQDRTPLNAMQWLGLSALVIGVFGCALVAMEEFNFFWPTCLYAFMCVWLVTIGAMGLLAIGNLTGGRWAMAARPFYLASASLLPLVAVLFIPIAFSLEHIYPWAAESTSAELHLPPGKADYLTESFFVGRAVGYFAVWLVIGWLLARVSRLDVPPGETSAMRRAGAAALVLLLPTATFAAFDWGMSLEPHWYSSIYGAMLAAGGVLAAHSLAIVSLHAATDAEIAATLTRLDWHHPDAADQHAQPDATASQVRNDLGNLLLAFLMVWTYFSLSQFILIWAANLPTEVTWYLRRLQDGWRWLAVAIFLLHFAVPFLLLLSRERKRMRGRLAGIAAWLLVMYAVNLYWIIVPAFDYVGWLWYAANIAALAAVGGFWLAAYSWQAKRRLHDGLTTTLTST